MRTDLTFITNEKDRNLLALYKSADELLKSHFSESAAQTTGPREVILSEYLLGK